MTRRLYHLGRWCARHGLLVLLLWVAALGLLNVADNRLPPPVPEAFVLEGTNSATAQTLLNRAFPGAAAQAAPLVVQRDAGLTDAQSQALLARIAADVLAVEDVNAVRTPADDPDLLAADGRTALISITVDERLSGAQQLGRAIQSAAEEAAGGEAQVALGGYLGNSISVVDTRRSEVLGLFTAVIILLVTLRRGWPVIVPFITAIMSVGCGLAIVGLLERFTYVPGEATILGTMLGLGVGIDYALFLVTRHRRLLMRGYGVVDSTGRTAGTAGAGMVFAGGTLIAAVCGLSLTGISFLAWLGFAAAIIVAIAVWAALTLVPALFGLLGPRVLPRRWRAEATGADSTGPLAADPAAHAADPAAHAADPAAHAADPAAHAAAAAHADNALDHGTWARISDSVTGRPWPYAIGATALLLLLAAPMLTMTFGQVDGTSLPAASPGHRATVLIAQGFGPGTNGPLTVAGQLYRAATAPQGDAADPPPGQSGDPRTRDPRLVAVTAALVGTSGIESVSDPVVSTDGGVVVWVVTPTTGPADEDTSALVHRLREQVLPAATAGRDMTAALGGVTPAITDLNERVAQRLVPFILGVVALSFLLLMVAYRSLVIPTKAAAMNLLSIAAAYGVVVMVFQWGWGATFIGLDGPVPIQSFVPMMMFAVLFGLSMDYEVFLLTSFTEHWQRTGDMKVAVRRGLADTGQVVTSAAAIMVVIFASFILTESDVAKMFGVGLGTAVLVDATVVRCVLVPALMILAARATWWLPGWLDRALPRLHVEGDPAALTTIDDRPARPAADPATPAVALWSAVLGVAVAWFLGIRANADAVGVPFGDVVIAVSATIGGLLAWLPRGTPGAGRAPAGRIAALLGGMVIAAVVFGAVRWLAPPVDFRPGFVGGWAILVCIAVVAATPLRRYGVPVILGGVAMVVSLAVGADGSAPGPLLRNALLPAMLALFVALVAQRIGVAVAGARTGDPSADPSGGVAAGAAAESGAGGAEGRLPIGVAR